MKDAQIQLQTDTWVNATWEEYIQAIANPALEKAKGYDHNGQLRIEMPPASYSYPNPRLLMAAAFARQGNCTYK